MSQIAVPFVGSTYTGRSVNIDPSRSVNLYPEITGSQEGGKVSAMVGTPGLSMFTSSIGASSAPVRAIYTFNNVFYAVVANQLYSVSSGGAGTLLGTLNTSTGRVSIKDNGIKAHGVGGNQLMLVDGTDGYIYNTLTTAFSTIASAGGWADLKTAGNPTMVEYLDGYFIVINGTMSFWVSNLFDGTTWNALATSPVGATTDTIVGVIAFQQQLYFLKQWSTEVWYDASIPTSTGSPFVRQSGAVYPFGLSSQWTLAKGGSNFYFLCSQRTDNGGEILGVAMVSAYSPTIISTPSMNYKIWSSSTVANFFAYTYVEQGHVFYVLTNPDDSWTIVFDATTNMWHERSSLQDDSINTPRHLSNCYTFYNGNHYVGDYRNANIYIMNSQYLTDNGNLIWRYRTAPAILDPSLHRDVFISRLIIDAETGVGSNNPVITAVTPFPAGWNGSANVLIKADGSITGGAMLIGVQNPQIYLSWSNDSGHTWSAEYPATLGGQAAYTTRLMWRRLGRARDKVFKLRVSDPVKVVLIGAYAEGGI